jgi:transketolase
MNEIMQTYEDILKELALRDERFIVMTAENRAPIRNLPGLLGDRFIDMGITEQAMIGAAAGLALRGRIPVTHALATFLTMRAFEFIRTDVGIANLPVKLVGNVPGFLSEANGPTHQALEDVALMRGIPPMTIFCPADEEDMVIGLKTMLQSPSPVYIRYNNIKPVIEHSSRFQIGKAELITDGSDITILVYGMLFNETIKTLQVLNYEGYSVRLINMRTLKPIDQKIILKAARETSFIVTIEDHFLTGGLYSIVAELLLKFQISGVRVLPIALEDRWFKPGLLSDVLKYEGFTGQQMAEKILKEVAVAKSLKHSMDSYEI